jgi:hypothetical protein
MELAIWASFILQFRVRNRAGGGDDLRGGDIATENARLGASGPIDLLDTESVRHSDRLDRIVGAVAARHVVGRAAHHIGLVGGQKYNGRRDRLGLDPGHAERRLCDQPPYGFV